MRNRHIARVCRHCQAPMASGARTCWRCGVVWATEQEPTTVLRLVSCDPRASDLAPAEAARRPATAAVART